MPLTDCRFSLLVLRVISRIFAQASLAFFLASMSHNHFVLWRVITLQTLSASASASSIRLARISLFSDVASPWRPAWCGAGLPTLRSLDVLRRNDLKVRALWCTWHQSCSVRWHCHGSQRLRLVHAVKIEHAVTGSVRYSGFGGWYIPLTNM